MSAREKAVIYCEGAFQSTYGKTAHGLLRRSRRYDIKAVIDSTCAGRNADNLIIGARPGVPIVSSLVEAIHLGKSTEEKLTHFVVGLAPDGGRLSEEGRTAVLDALNEGLNLVSGLHDFLTDDDDLASIAWRNRVTIKDVRKPPPRSELHSFSGEIEKVGALRIAMLGTDSAVGKRTTAWMLVDALNEAGLRADMIGTGQTAWLQGARYGVMLDSLINDFVSGEIEHAIMRAWRDEQPDVLVLEGQGSLLNPAYPGGFELLAAGRPHAIVLQHAPGRRDYDGFPGYKIHSLARQIAALELISDRPVIALTINREGLHEEEINGICEAIHGETGIPVLEPFLHGTESIVDMIKPWQQRPEASVPFEFHDERAS